MEVAIIPTLKDNYTYAVMDESARGVLIIDPGEAAPVMEWCQTHNRPVDAIFCTHHHADHVDGVPELKDTFKAKVWSSTYDKSRIPGADQGVSENTGFQWQTLEADVLEIPGHTLGHVALYFSAHQALFCGDTLFSMGCGRLFEGSAEQLYDSLMKLARLPGETQIFCGHEYTVQNGPFALHVNSTNLEVVQRVRQARALSEKGQPTIPTTMALELKTNPFLRPFDRELRAFLVAAVNESDVEIFRRLRLSKDAYS